MFVAVLPPFLQDRYENYRRIADEAIQRARVEETTKNRNKYFTAWCFFVRPWGTDPYLGKSVPFTERMHHITSFGAMVRTGELGHGKQIRVGSVRTAIAAVAQTIAMDRGEMPLHNEVGNYHAPLSLMLDGFK